MPEPTIRERRERVLAAIAAIRKVEAYQAAIYDDPKAGGDDFREAVLDVIEVKRRFADLAEDVRILIAAYREANKPFAALGRSFGDSERSPCRNEYTVASHSSGAFITFGDLRHAAELEGE